MARQIPYWETKWTTLEGHSILRVPGSKFAALPLTGKKNARTFAIFNVDDRKELLQLRKKEVSVWLAQKAKDEGVKPTGHIEGSKPTPKRKAIATPQIGGVQPKPLKKNPRFKTGRKSAKRKTGGGHRGVVEQDTSAGYIIETQGKHAGIIKKNPTPGRIGRAVKKAVKLYSDFTGHDPKFIDEWVLEIPAAAMQVGKITGIMYTTRMDGREQEFLHEFSGRSRPILAASADGRQLLILGGEYHFSDRGIIDGTASLRR